MILVRLIKVEESSLWWELVDGAPEGIRIPDRRYRKPVLYPAELRTHIKENEIIADKT